ncbi:MAG TPA: hypothetical protein VM369_02570 [Candidatus Binatia bacterium]|nr:hypothetical protein [Candidatus Binatia bacterium]
MRPLRVPLLLGFLLAAGCAAPQWYERHAAVLGGAGLDDFRVRHEEPGDCAWRQRFPSDYTVDRGPYRLRLLAPVRFAEEPLVLTLEITGEGEPSATVEGAAAAEDALAPAGLRRYRLRLPAERGALRIAVQRDGRAIGAEELSFHEERCRALLWRG